MRTTILFLMILITSSLGAQTFSSNIAEIFYNRCTSCHRTGGIAPFNIVSYQDVQNHVGGIYDAIAQDRMPPWPPDNNYSQLLHSRALNAQEKSTLLDWLNNGMPEGNSNETPPPPVYPVGSILGGGDLTLQIPTYTSAATAQSDNYVCISVPSGLTTSKKIRAIEIVPGNPAIVHHCLMYIDITGNYQTNTNGTCTGPTGQNYKLAAGYAPGATPMVFPNSAELKLGLTIPAGSNMVFALHYPSGSGGQQDSTKVILHFYPDDVTGIREIQANPVLENWQFSLPPNQFTTVNAQQNIPTAVSMLSIFPHMHLIGKSIKAYGLHQGDTIKLINIPKWDFHWQGFYVFKNMKKIPGSTSLRGQGIYDNTATNIHNPHNPPITVSPGLNTTDEMFIFYAHYLPYVEGDELHDLEQMTSLSLDEFMHHWSSDIKIHPNPFSNHVNIDLSQVSFQKGLSIAIYDTQGKMIKRLNHQNETQLIWDGTNQLSEQTNPGMYYVSILIDGKQNISKPIIRF